MKCRVNRCECGNGTFVFHRSKSKFQLDHYHCRKCRKEYGRTTTGENESEHLTEADYQTWAK